jgi:hypothetical protein
MRVSRSPTNLRRPPGAIDADIATGSTVADVGADRRLPHQRNENTMTKVTVNDLLAMDSPDFPRPPVFTLGSALRWLGHDCPDHCCCWAPIDTLKASVWFLRRGPQCRLLPPQTRVLVDAIEIGDAAASIRRLIFEINGCTRRDAIEVRYRPRCVAGRPRQSVSPRLPLLTQFRLVFPDEVPVSHGAELRSIGEASRS